MDRQLAERMVGAACLLAVLVAVVPALLDGNQAPESNGPDSALPEVRDLRRHTLSLDSEARVPPVPVLPDRPGDAAGTLPVDDVPDGVAAAPVELPDATAPVAGPDVGNSVVDASATAGQTAAVAPGAEAPAPPVPAPAAEAPVLPGTGQWYVQLGVFSSQQNAEGLKKKLADAGFEATLRKSNRGLRVLVGPRADRDAAVTLAGKLKAAGYTGQVTRL
jgi:DedD protein